MLWWKSNPTMFLLVNEDGYVGVDRAISLLKKKVSAIDVVVEGITLVEEDPSSPIVGLGGIPDIGGNISLDAAIMDGEAVNFGAVGYIRKYVNAIQIARRVLSDSPHCLLVGEGAERFANEMGILARSPSTKKSESEWKELFVKYVDKTIPKTLDGLELARWCKNAILKAHGHHFKDTTVFLGKDYDNNIAVGTSTSGWPLKYPGRLGDSPIPGAGFYADNEWGAAACTNTGEMALRANTSFAVVQYMKSGMSVDNAVYQAVSDLARLKGGLLADLIVHGVDTQGNYKVICYHSKIKGEDTPKFWYWHKDKCPTLKLIEAETVRKADIKT